MTAASNPRSRVLLATALSLAVTVIAMIVAMILIESDARSTATLSTAEAAAQSEQVLRTGVALGLALVGLGLGFAAVVAPREREWTGFATAEDSKDFVGIADQQREEPAMSELFVRLTRRNLSLAERQLVLIDELEMDADPELLSDLFEVDNLVTQMRRNTESLLVLAGNTPRSEDSPIDFADVLRIAIGQVEEYPRVDLGDVSSRRVAADFVVPIAHLVSELLDVVLRGCDEPATVSLSARSLRDGSAEIKVSTIGDTMSETQVEETKQTFADQPALSLPSSRSLGLAVAKNLACRFGVALAVRASGDGHSIVCSLPPSALAATVELFDQDVAPTANRGQSLEVA
ncbi:MAG: hypothetical protein V3V01_12670 [Acidimicrobiales bacterium]